MEFKSGREKILRLKLSDVRAVTFHKDVFLNPISLNQVHEIINFIQKWNGHDFIVNCAAGISRSGAIAMFLHLHFGYELKPNFYKLSEPNPFVLGLLIMEFYKLNMNVYEYNN